MDSKTKKILNATRQENENPAIDFASTQRKRVLSQMPSPVSKNGTIQSPVSGQFGGFLKKDK